MATTGGAKGNSRRGKATKAATNDTVDNAVDQEETMADQEKAPGNGEAAQSSKAGKLELAKKPEAESNGRTESNLALHTQHQPGEIEVAESFYSAGLRPIGASHLEIYGMILKDRPIMASHLQVVEYALPGQRPVFASDMVVRDELTLSGGRPIVASDPKLLEASLLPGGRPIASNEIDDSETLMGFID